MKKIVSFRERVLDVVRRIPRGKTLSYKQVAWAAGSPNAFRAVGNIMATNRDKDVPCHRVIRSDGKAGGYNGLRGEKKRLLKLEGALILCLLLVGSQAQAHGGEMNPTGLEEQMDHLRDAVADNGVNAAFEELRSWIKAGDDNVMQNCHTLSHVIGQEAVKHTDSLAAAFVLGSADCFSGYYHGVLEGKFGETTSTDVLESASTACDSASGDPRLTFACLHGLGHAVMGATGHELPESLSICSKFATEFQRNSCASGVFMENFTQTASDRPSKYLKTDDPLFPCNTAPQNFQAACFDIQSSYVLRLNQWDFPDAFTTCARPDADHVRCWHGIGLEAYGHFSGDSERINKACQTDDHAAETACRVGVGQFIATYVTERDPKSACEGLGWWRGWLCRREVQKYQETFEPKQSWWQRLMKWFGGAT